MIDIIKSFRSKFHDLSDGKTVDYLEYGIDNELVLYYRRVENKVATEWDSTFATEEWTLAEMKEVVDHFGKYLSFENFK